MSAWRQWSQQGKQWLDRHTAPYRTRFLLYWQGLQQREKNLVIGLGCLVGVTFLWLGVWKPIHESVAATQIKHQHQQRYYTWFSEQAQTVFQMQQAHAQQQPPAQATGSLPTVLNQLTAQYGLTIARMQPQNQAHIVVIDEAPFEVVLQLIQQIELQGFRIDSMDLAETNTPGVVRIRRLQVSGGEA